MRDFNRSARELRPITITRNFTTNAPGSVLMAYGNTKVLCTASINRMVPKFLKGTESGWLTAEYSLLPSATHERSPRDVHGISGRSQEIQRLIGRCLRQAIDLRQIPELTINIDCDVLQADGSTRVASITGGCIALYDALAALGDSYRGAFRQWIAAVSVGLVDADLLLDLNYQEDSAASFDFNVVINQQQQLIEIQGTAEKQAIEQTSLHTMLTLATDGCQQLILRQQRAVA